MRLDVYRKIRTLDQLAQQAREHRAAGRRIVLCHGCFDIVHPGHLRYLQFARTQGQVLVVTLTADDAIEKSDGTRPYVPQELRAEALATLEIVDHVAVIDGPTAEPVIRALQPDVYVKGREYESSTHPGFIAEKQLVEQLGGQVIFSSGDVVFSSTAILDQLGQSQLDRQSDPSLRLATCCRRWGIDQVGMTHKLRQQMPGKRVVVVGDALLDRYIFCDAGERSGEAPILTVRPQQQQHYPGGAAIIACHLQAQGAQVHLISSMGDDADSHGLTDQLQARGITVHRLLARPKLPVKTRYLVESQKLLKVDDAAAQPLDGSAQKKLLSILHDLRKQLDAAVFVDFGCGTLSPSNLTKAIAAVRPHVGIISGDVSGPRRTLLAFEGVDLLTPHERELRGVMGDYDASLPGVAMNLMRQLRLSNLAVTLGAKGCLLFRPRETERDEWFTNRLRSEYMPTLGHHVIDPVGAGDALLATATLALSAGATLTQAGYLGSAAAAIQVAHLGNHIIDTNALLQWLGQRPELRQSLSATG